MATTALSTVTNVICEEEGYHPAITVRTTGTDLKPGMLVTCTGETVGVWDVDLPGAADEIVAGILGLKEGHNIDEAYADNEAVPMYPKHCGAKVWGWFKANCGDVVYNAPLIHTGAAVADGFASGGELVNEYVGTAARGSANDATNDRPALIWLV